ncbi:MAG: hypothetical protein FJ144_11280 [Deltaproteobacteria bacterium]|nr:hypothetical protein [Deltaproteobacteria bacterium]
MLLWIHLAATGLYLGTTAGLAAFALPSAARAETPRTRRRRLARVLRAYDPIAIGLLGVMVMTGAWTITGYKETLGEAYFETFGRQLVWKLGLAFLVVMSGTYVAMGLGHRIVREEDWGDEVDEGKLGGMVSRLRGAAWITIAVTLATVVFSIVK